MCIITEKLISLFIRSSVLACEYDTVTNTIRLSCLTIASSATKKLGPDKKRFNAMAAIYGVIENVTPAFPPRLLGSSPEGTIRGRLSQSRSLLIEWTWHERLLSLVARQIYRRNFPPVALSNQEQRYESTRQSN